MPTQAQWEALKPDYRARLIRGGYTREDYLANVPRVAQRGHGKTPEHPERAARHPERYPEYTAARTPTQRAVAALTPVTQDRRDRLYDRVFEEMIELLRLGKRLGGIDRFDATTLEYGIMNADPALFRHMETLTIDEWRDFGRHPYTGPGSATWDDEQQPNPFFYH